jgi:SAM-dependent methyltransferase
LKALAAQLGATALLLTALRSGQLPPLQPLALAALQGAMAALGARLLRADPWWIPLHLLFAPAIVVAMHGGLPAWTYLAGFIALLAVFWTTFRSQVPLFLSNRSTLAVLAAWLPRTRPLSILDVGSGLGGLVLGLARRRTDCRVSGIELAPLPAAIARLAARRTPNASLRRGDLWQEPLAAYDVVYAFLSPVPMPALWRKASAEMRAGSWLVSNSFAVPDVEPTSVLSVDDARGTRLYCYCMPGAADDAGGD